MGASNSPSSSVTPTLSLSNTPSNIPSVSPTPSRSSAPSASPSASPAPKLLVASNPRASAGATLGGAAGSTNVTLLEGSTVTFTVFVTDNFALTPAAIPAGTVVAVGVQFASSPNAACAFSAARQATASAVFLLTPVANTVDVVISAPRNSLVDGTSCALAAVAVVGASTTAAAFAAGVAPLTPFPVTVLDANVAVVSFAPVAGLPASPAMTDAAGASVTLTAALSADPGAGTSVPVTFAASPALALSPSSFTFTSANWASGVNVSVAANPAISFAVPAALPVTAATTAATAIGGAWTPGAVSVRLVRMSTLVPVVTAPASVTKGGSATVLVALGAVPPAAFVAALSFSTGSAPMNGPSLVVAAPASGAISFPASSAALANQSVTISFASNPFASAGETAQLCLAVPGLAQLVCSSPIALIDTVQPGLVPVAVQTLVSGAWATYLPDGVTVRLQEGATTLFSVRVTTGLVGTLTASVSNSASSYASAVTAVATIANASAPAFLAVSGKVITPAASASDTTRMGTFTIRVLATAGASGLVDSGYQTPIFAFVPYVLMNPGTAVVAAVPPSLTASFAAGAFILEGGDGVQVNVSIAPPVSANQVVVQLALPSPLRTTASATYVTFSASTPSWSFVTLSAIDDNVAFDLRLPLAFTASVASAGTTAVSYLAAAPAAFSIVLQDNDIPALVISGAGSGAGSPSVSVTEGGAAASFGVALSCALPPGVTVSVAATSAAGVCGAPAAPLTSFAAPCFSNSDCSASSSCVLPTTLLPFKLASAPAAALVFDAVNWATPQLLPVTAPREGVVEGAQGGLVSVAVTAGPSQFLAAPAAGVKVAITDADKPGVTVAAVGAIREADGQGQATVTFLTTPLAAVTVSIAVADPLGQVSVTPTTFTAAGLSRTVLVSVQQSSVARGAGPFNNFSVPVAFTLTSADPAYNLVVNSFLVVVDADAAGVAISTLASVAAEGGASLARFRVSLSSQPLAPVKVTFTEAASSASFTPLPASAYSCTALPASGSQLVPATAGDASATPVVASVTIAPADWSVPVDIYVAARADARVEGTMSVGIVPSTSSSDATYQALAGLGAASVTVTEYDLAAPPQLPTAQFANDYGSATITFPQDVSLAGISAGFDCTQAFTVVKSSDPAPSAARLCATASGAAAAELAATNAALGAGQRCYVASSRSITVQFGAGPTVNAGDKFVLFGSTVRWNSTALLFTTGSFAITAAASPPAPTALFAGGATALTAGLCDVAFVAGAIGNTGGRPYTITWSAAAGSAAVTPSLAATIAAANAAQAVGISVDAAGVVPGASASISLKVTNWLGLSSTSTLAFTRIGLAPPALSVPAPTTVTRSAGLLVAVRATLSACGNATSGSLRFFWSSLTSTSSLPSSLGAGATAPAGAPSAGGTYLGGLLDLRSLSIAPTDLQAGTYSFSVVTAPSTNLAAYSSGVATVTVVYDALVASIAGGAGSLVQAGADYALDASQSGEPTAALRALQTGIAYQWSCTVVLTGASCSSSLVNPTAARAMLSGAALTAGLSFLVGLTVSAPGRASVSASQTVTVSGTLVPALTLVINEPFVAGTANTVAANSRVTFTAAATLAGVSAFSYAFSSSQIPASALNSNNQSVVAVDSSALSPGSVYTVCVAAQSFVPVVSQGQTCISFATAALPTVGGVTVALLSASTHSYSVTVGAVGSAVSSLVFAYLADATAAMAQFKLADPAAAALALARAQGPNALAVFDQRDAATSGVSTTLLPAGNLSICVFGLSSAGGFAVSCAAAQIAPVVLSSNDVSSLIGSAGSSGDVTSILGSINFINKASSGGAAGRRRRAQASSSATQAGILNLLAISYAATVKDGTGSKLATVVSTLAGSSANIGATNNATLLAQCVGLANSCVASMNAFALPINSATWSSVATSLVNCQSSQAAAVTALLRGLSSGRFQASFGVTVGKVFLGGASGLSRPDIVAGSATVSSVPVASSAATALLPAVVVSSGGALQAPAGAVVLSGPLEVQMVGAPARAAGAAVTPLFSIAFAGVSSTTPAAVTGAYTGADGSLRFDGIATQYAPPATGLAGTYTVIASHNSTFFLSQNSGPATVIVSVFGGGAAYAAVAVNESAAVTLYARLATQPQSNVSVAVSLPAGVCYSTASGVMAVSSGLAVTCMKPGAAGQCASAAQDCRATLATFAPAGPLVFTPANWASPQSLLVSGTADNVFEPEAPVVGTMRESSSPPRASGGRSAEQLADTSATFSARAPASVPAHDRAPRPRALTLARTPRARATCPLAPPNPPAFRPPARAPARSLARSLPSLYALFCGHALRLRGPVR